MKVFRYTAVGPSGNKIGGTVIAEEIESAADKVRFIYYPARITNLVVREEN